MKYVGIGTSRLRVTYSSSSWSGSSASPSGPAACHAAKAHSTADKRLRRFAINALIAASDAVSTDYKDFACKRQLQACAYAAPDGGKKEPTQNR